MPGSRRRPARGAFASLVAGALVIAIVVAAGPAVADEPTPLREGAVGSLVHTGQVRLQWLGYGIDGEEFNTRQMGPSTAAAVRAFQQKFDLRVSGIIGARTWARLADVAGRIGRLPTACLGERTVCIDTSQRLVRLVTDDQVVLTLDARFGIDGDTTRDGTFRVYWKSRDHMSSRYRTWMPFALFFAGGQAVHYSPYFARDGYRGGSHGCVNLRDFAKARWLFTHVPVGTRVHVYG